MSADFQTVASEASRRKPKPVPDAYSSAYWEAAAERRLVIRRCVDCGTYQHPPLAFCLNCRSESITTAEVSGAGSVRSFVIIHETPVPGFEDATPYAFAAIELVEQSDIIIYANLCSGLEEVRIGADVSVVWEELSDDVTLPQFRIVGEG